MAIPTLDNIPELDIYNIFMSFISDNVTDIRTNRKNSGWVFSKFPTNDSNYPECVVDINSSTPNSTSAAQFLAQEKNGAGQVTKEMYFIKEECPIKLRVLSLKDSNYIVNTGIRDLNLKDKTVNLYLQDKIKRIFMFKYLDLIKNYKYDDISIIEKVRVTSVDRVYEANSRVWATDITVTIDFKNLYIKEYNEGELINEYSLILNLETD